GESIRSNIAMIESSLDEIKEILDPLLTRIHILEILEFLLPWIRRTYEELKGFRKKHSKLWLQKDCGFRKKRFEMASKLWWHFYSVLRRYNRAQLEHRKGCQRFIKTLLIFYMSIRTTDQELEDMLKQGNLSVLTQGIKMITQQGKQKLANIEARGADITNLDELIQEVYGMLRDIQFIEERQMPPPNQRPAPDQPFPPSTERQTSTIPKADKNENWQYPSEQMPPPNQRPALDQTFPLSTERQTSTIPKADKNENWKYPSEQMPPPNQRPAPDQPFPPSTERQTSTIPKADKNENRQYPSEQMPPPNQRPAPDQPFPPSTERQTSTIPKADKNENRQYPSEQYKNSFMRYNSWFRWLRWVPLAVSNWQYPSEQMPPPNQRPAPDQTFPLSTERQTSTIPKADKNENWQYPSEQFVPRRLLKRRIVSVSPGQNNRTIPESSSNELSNGKDEPPIKRNKIGYSLRKCIDAVENVVDIEVVEMAQPTDPQFNTVLEEVENIAETLSEPISSLPMKDEASEGTLILEDNISNRLNSAYTFDVPLTDETAESNNVDSVAETNNLVIVSEGDCKSWGDLVLRPNHLPAIDPLEGTSSLYIRRKSRGRNDQPTSINDPSKKISKKFKSADEKGRNSKDLATRRTSSCQKKMAKRFLLANDERCQILSLDNETGNLETEVKNSYVQKTEITSNDIAEDCATEDSAVEKTVFADPTIIDDGSPNLSRNPGRRRAMSETIVSV
ncbi:hypothetical protein QYM36_014130, partial [Artemia franciscana]